MSEQLHRKIGQTAEVIERRSPMSKSKEITTIDQDSYLSPVNFDHSLRIANMMSKSQMVPKAYIGKPQDIIIAMEMGRALRLSPLSAIQNIAVINGKPVIYGDAILAICSGHPEFEDISEEPIHDKDNKIIGYRCSVKRHGRTPVSHIFTIDNAKAAQLWGKQGPWTQYPDRMLQMRARSFALRDSFADALGGVRIVEEVQDYREVKDITPKQSQSSAVADLKSIIDNNKVDKALQVDPETGEVLPEDLQ